MGENEKIAGLQGKAIPEVTVAAETPEMVRADAVDTTDAVPFLELALFLAKSYGTMLKDRDRLKAVIDAGIQPYTEEQAIRDLSAISIDYESERVQTSNISNVPERIAEMLDSGYVEKMNRRLRYEYGQAVKEYDYLAWKIEVVETAMRERMDKKERAIFERLYARGKSYREICKAYKKGTLHCTQISTLRKRCLQAISDHLKFVSAFSHYAGYMENLSKEYQAESEDEK